MECVCNNHISPPLSLPVPGTPGQPMVADMGITWVRLQWDPPTNPQGIITSYTVSTLCIDSIPVL